MIQIKIRIVQKKKTGNEPRQLTFFTEMVKFEELVFIESNTFYDVIKR